ncbi:MAG: outer membrane lipoprotein carrier protein LolA [Prevotella sp.]|nr:outer membrane lipoprotein carrier protein LolA [Prevotella sp.]
MKRLLILLFVFTSVHLSLTAQQSEAQIRQAITQAASAMKTMQCDFTQTKHLRMLNDKMTSKGRMYYQQTNRLRWEYTSPYSYTFILNDDKVLLKNKQRNDVIDVNKNKLFREIARIMMNSVVGTSLTDDKSFKSAIATNGNEWIASLLPQRKDLKQLFQKIILHFSKKNAMVKQVELIEKNGDKTVIELNNIRTNEKISADMFTIR